jgi:hypothetical protein
VCKEERQRDIEPEGNDEIAQQRQADNDAGHDDRQGDDGADRFAEGQPVTRKRVGCRDAKGKGGSRPADGKQHRHGEALAEALDLEDLCDPFQRKALRRKGKRFAPRQRCRDDDEEGADQKRGDEYEHRYREKTGIHRLLLAVASRFKRRLAAKLMTIRMKAMTLAETKSLATVTR